MPNFSIELKASEKYCLIFNSCTDLTLNCWPADKNQLEYLDTHLARSTLVMFRTELVSSCDQQAGWPQKPKIFIDFRVRDQIYKDNFHSWEFKHFNDSEVGTTATVLWKPWYILPPNALQALELWRKALPGLLRAISEHIRCVQIRTLQPELPQAGVRSGVQESQPCQPWELRFCYKEVAAEDQSFSTQTHGNHVYIFLLLWLCPEELPGCGWACWVLEFPHCELAAVPWALGVLGDPSSPSSLRSSLWWVFPWNLPAFESQTIDKSEWLFPAQWDFGQGLTSTLGSHSSPFPAFPRKSSHKREQILLFGLAFIHVPAR